MGDVAFLLSFVFLSALVFILTFAILTANQQWLVPMRDVWRVVKNTAMTTRLQNTKLSNAKKAVEQAVISSWAATQNQIAPTGTY